MKLQLTINMKDRLENKLDFRRCSVSSPVSVPPREETFGEGALTKKKAHVENG